MSKSLHYLIAPNSFKGSMDANEAAEAIERGIKKANQENKATKLPIADGGDHFCDVLTKALDGELIEVDVLDPLERAHKARFGIVSGNVAIIEMAKASGLALLKKEELNPLAATSYGTGQLMKAALDRHCKEIVLGIGGSATNDAGVGILEALGIQFLDEKGNAVKRGGGYLKNIKKILTENLDPRLKECHIQIACDVENPLLGKKGAAHVFGPQKGANPDEVVELADSHAYFSEITKKTLDIDISTLPHGGAAGGIAAGLYAYLGAALVNGIELVLSHLHFEKHLPKSDVVITAEGNLDEQTLDGKGPYGIALRAREAGKIVIGFAGKIPSHNLEAFTAFDGLYSITDGPMSLENAIEDGARLLENIAFQTAKLLKGVSK